MARCIELSRTALGELSFASIIYKDGSVITETTNRVSLDNDVTRHAEMVAISTAQQVLGRKRLTGCTFYSNVEPCVMCALALRETGVSKVVFSIESPVSDGRLFEVECTWRSYALDGHGGILSEATGGRTGIAHAGGRSHLARLESVHLGRNQEERTFRWAFSSLWR
jgi:tRNA(Arg) A34 adenosine deaminase TadA